MKNMFSKMSRRERLYLLVGATVLLLGMVVYPMTRKGAAYREEQQALLENEMALLEDFHGLSRDGSAIAEEYEILRSALRAANDLLFPPIENPILTQTAMIKLLNELGPDLELEITSGRSSVGDAANQLNLSLRGQGRYPEILKFIYRLETYRPLILVESFSMEERRSRGRGGFSRRRGFSRRVAVVESAAEPTLTFRASLQIICQEKGESQ